MEQEPKPKPVKKVVKKVVKEVDIEDVVKEPKVKKEPKPKKERSPEQLLADKERMSKLRALKGKKTVV